MYLSGINACVSSYLLDYNLGIYLKVVLVFKHHQEDSYWSINVDHNNLNLDANLICLYLLGIGKYWTSIGCDRYCLMSGVILNWLSAP